MIVTQSLEGIPGRFQSSEGLTPAQAKALTQLIDEARSNISALVKQEGF